MIKKINWISVAQIVMVFAIALMPVMQVQGAQTIADTVECNKLFGLNCENVSLQDFLRRIINWMLALAGLIAVLFLIYGGFLYITSAGNEESAEKGKNTVINAVIGLVVIILSAVIVNVVANFFTTR
jgi:hypothetical protein